METLNKVSYLCYEIDYIELSDTIIIDHIKQLPLYKSLPACGVAASTVEVTVCLWGPSVLK